MMKSKPLFPLIALLAVVLVIPALSAQAVDFYLYAGQTNVVMPDATNVPVWGFALEPDNDFTTLEGTVQVPGPHLVVDPAETVVNIYLRNTLDVPVSLIITGQIPSASNGPVVRLAEGDGNYPAPAGTGGRIRSFAKEVAPGGMEMYSWPNFRNGSFMYKSGTHQQVQVPMGLYGGITKDLSAGVAYDDGNGFEVTYDSEVVLFYSELDPALNTAVTTPGGYGAGTAMPSALNFNPKYFLVNGQPYPAAGPLVTGTPTVGQATLLRFFNASLQSLVPMIVGEHMDQVAEDGNQYPHPFTQYTVTLPAGKTKDAVFAPDRAGSYPVIERRLHLTNAAAGDGGQQVFIDVVAEPGKPVAVADAYFLDEDTSLTVPGGSFVGVLANDSDGGAPNGAGNTAVLVQGPQNAASFTLNPDGSFNYTPNANYFGGDFFLYVFDDGALQSEPVAAVLRVDPINDPPTGVADAYTTREDLLLTVPAPGVAANDVDPDGDSFIVSLVSPPAQGSLTLLGNGRFTYMPPANWFGVTTFSYQATDAQGATTGPIQATITVESVNDVPFTVADLYWPVAPDAPFNVPAPGLLVNDSDIENDPLTPVLARAPWNGAVTINADGSFTYTPDPGFTGRDDFRYKVNDGDLNSLEATVTLFVYPAGVMSFVDTFDNGTLDAWSAVSP